MPYDFFNILKWKKRDWEIVIQTLSYLSLILIVLGFIFQLQLEKPLGDYVISLNETSLLGQTKDLGGQSVSTYTLTVNEITQSCVTVTITSVNPQTPDRLMQIYCEGQTIPFDDFKLFIKNTYQEKKEIVVTKIKIIKLSEFQLVITFFVMYTLYCILHFPFKKYVQKSKRK